MINAICFGEVLWDVFPKHSKIGGAPLNVATRLQSFNNNVSIISRIGKDKQGEDILSFLTQKEVNIEAIQTDAVYKTGTVNVMLNEKGSASYDIMFPRAWDKIELEEKAKTNTKKSDVFIYGSLASRNDETRETLYALLKFAKYKVFDINLRPPYYSITVLKHLMKEANFIKFNDEEIFEIANALNSETNSLEQNIRFLAKETDTETICVTKGRHGAILYCNDTFYYNSGYQISVVDTVGAGDSFLATIINALLKNNSPQEALNTACAVGAIVASREGANPEITEKELEQMMKA